MPIELCPVSFKDACEFIRQYHRHHKPPCRWKFGVGAQLDNKLVGVVMIGRPVARHLDDGWTLEVTRLCTDGTPHVASKLYSAAWRAARAIGYRRIITYTLENEAGTSLIAAGWKELYKTKGGTWNTPARPREQKSPTCPKTLWEVKGT